MGWVSCWFALSVILRVGLVHTISTCDSATSDGVYKLDAPLNFDVYCKHDRGEWWTVFQRRVSADVDFERDWKTYMNGFGDLKTNFWLGLEELHKLAPPGNPGTRLRVNLKSGHETVSADYSTFAIGPESQGYKLTVDGYSGDAGDAMVVHNGAPFSTTDAGRKRKCARAYKGGWWYVECHHSNLNGVYHGGDHSSNADGVNWYQWKGYKHSVDSTMMLRHVPPTPSPTGAPTTSAPTALPTRSPTANPTYSPTFQPTSKPTNAPSPPTAYPTPAQYHLGERGSNACDYGDAPSDAQSCREVAVAALPLDRNPTEDDFKALPNWSIIPPRGSQRLHEISEGHAPPGCSVRILPGGTIDKEVQQWDAVWNREDFAVNDGNYAVVCSGLDSTKKKPF